MKNWNPLLRRSVDATVLALAFIFAQDGFAQPNAPTMAIDPKTKTWEQIPPAVRATILANGGVAGQSADKEKKALNGKAVYEAPVKDKEGLVTDLVITEDGALVQAKHDDAADRAEELAAAVRPADSAAAAPRFSHPKDITNPYLPLIYLKQDIIEGKEDGKAVRVERIFRPDLKKIFVISGQKVEAAVFEDREFQDGQLEEVAIDYFAQDDSGTVYYLGEDVDEYKDGKVVGHSGSWLLGVDTQTPGVLFPAHPKVGDVFKSEDVSATIREVDTVVSISETVTVPAGTFHDCVKIKEVLADGTTEIKYYAPGTGVVKEGAADSPEVLISHRTR